MAPAPAGKHDALDCSCLGGRFGPVHKRTREKPPVIGTRSGPVRISRCGGTPPLRLAAVG